MKSRSIRLSHSTSVGDIATDGGVIIHLKSFVTRRDSAENFVDDGAADVGVFEHRKSAFPRLDGADTFAIRCWIR